MPAETNLAPDSGTTSGSRQTLVTGEAARRACGLILQDLKGGKQLFSLNGKEYFGEYLAATDPMGSEKKNPVSHVAYGFATQVVCLKEDGTVEQVIAAHDVGKAINPLSVEGQIEGGVLHVTGIRSDRGISAGSWYAPRKVRNSGDYFVQIRHRMYKV